MASFFVAFFPQNKKQKAYIYPSTIGVPKLGVLGLSGAGKSALLRKLLELSVSSSSNIVGNSSYQTTGLPTHYYLNSSFLRGYLRLRITIRSFPENTFKVDEDAVFNAIQHSLTSYAKASKGSGISLSNLAKYIDSGQYANDFCNSVNGAARFEQLNTEELLGLISFCTKSLLEDFDMSTETEEGRQIQNSRISVYVGMSE